MKALKKYIAIVTYQIGVNIIGLPIYWNNYILSSYKFEIKSKYHK